MSSRFLRGSSILSGNNTTPGDHLTKQEIECFSKVIKACRDYGCDFYPTIINKLRYDEMYEIAAYGGFPRRYPHWSWGMEYGQMSREYEYGLMRIYEMVINCIDLATPVLTERGTMPASQVKVGDRVIVGEETRTVVAVKLQKPSQAKVVKLHHGQKLVCTPEHKWRVLSDHGLVWKEARDIARGDLLVGCDNIFKNKPARLHWSDDSIREQTKSNVRWALRDIEPPTDMTLELAELLGILTGDGSVGVHGADNQVVVSVGKDFPKFAQHVADLMRAVFVGATIHVYEKPACRTVVCCSKAAVDFLDTIGFTKGSTYVNKRVPFTIWQSSNEYRGAYLRGLFDTDGYASDVVGMSCYNEALANDVQVLLSEMGIQTALEVVPNGLGKNSEEHFIHTVELRGRAAIRKFAERVGFWFPYKMAGLLSLCEAGASRGGGLKVPHLQAELVKWAESLGITRSNQPSLGRSIDLMRKKSVGVNCLSSFIDRAESLGIAVSSYLKDLLNNPIFMVESVEDGEVVETVDIALDHDAHDFVAGGMLTHNTNPCHIYILNSNTLMDNIMVVAHATFHNDFFKNNIYFQPTAVNDPHAENMMNKLANHGSRIQKYMNRWGMERVTEFIDHVLRIHTLIDLSKIWDHRPIKDVVIRDERKYEFPRLLNVSEDRRYMDPYINPREYIDREKERIQKHEVEKELGLFRGEEKDIFGFIKDHAPLKPWQQDIISMLYEEELYFGPQRMTKTLNEGWASMGDYEIMARQGYVGLGQKTHDCGIVEYAKHKMGVLGGKYSMNPYKIGFYLLLDIEDRWNKGQFGPEWDDCKDWGKKQSWDKKLGLGKEKIFEVRKYYDDLTFILEFFTQDFCDKYEFYEWKKYPNGETKIESRDYKVIKKKLLQRYVNAGLPDIRLMDPNHKDKGWMLLEHKYDGRDLYDPYARATLNSLYYLWGRDVVLITKNQSGEEIVYVCGGSDPEKDVAKVSREEYDRRW